VLFYIYNHDVTLTLYINLAVFYTNIQHQSSQLFDFSSKNCVHLFNIRRRYVQRFSAMFFDSQCTPPMYLL